MSSTTRKRKTEEHDYSVEQVLNKRLTDEGKLQYFVKWRGIPRSGSTWESIEDLNCLRLINAFENSFKCTSTVKKRKTKASSESLPVKKADGKTLTDINSLPRKILVKIFGFLKQNELGLIARVCKRWRVYTKDPVLWEKVDVELFGPSPSQYVTTMRFLEKLPNTSVTHLKLKFDSCYWSAPIIFEKLTEYLEETFPYLHTLIFHHAVFQRSFQYVLDECTVFLPNLKVLSFRYSKFYSYSRRQYDDEISKIEVLDACFCSYVSFMDFPLISKLPCLKKLLLGHTSVDDMWFSEIISVIQHIEVLNLEQTKISFDIFKILQKHALKLTELYLCHTDLEDNHMNFSSPVFPQLKTICLRNCSKLTCEDIVSLIKFCQSLQNIYVCESLAESFANHPFAEANECKKEIVKISFKCSHHLNMDYLH